MHEQLKPGHFSFSSSSLGLGTRLYFPMPIDADLRRQEVTYRHVNHKNCQNWRVGACAGLGPCARLGACTGDGRLCRTILSSVLSIIGIYFSYYGLSIPMYNTPAPPGKITQSYRATKATTLFSSVSPLKLRSNIVKTSYTIIIHKQMSCNASDLCSALDYAVSSHP